MVCSILLRVAIRGPCPGRVSRRDTVLLLLPALSTEPSRETLPAALLRFVFVLPTFSFRGSTLRLRVDLVRRPTGLTESRSPDALGGDDAEFLEMADLADARPLVFGGISESDALYTPRSNFERRPR